MSKAKKQKNANKHRALSAQQTIPYIAMHPDGICQIPGGLYTKTLEYEDINYAVASTEDQTAIISGWSACLNYFDSSLPFQLSFVNRRSRNANRYKVNIPAQEDDFNSIRGEYVEMLKGQIAKSNNGIERYKYITFGLPAEGATEARPRLGRVEADVMGNLKRLGVQSRPLDGRDRLAVLHGQMHPGGREPFRFAWKDIPKTGMGTKDYIAPDSFDFRQSRTFRVGQMWGAASYLQIMASELSDKLLAEILELDAELTVTMHIQTVDQLKAIKTIKGKISDIGRMKAEEQKKAVRAGYDMEILPPDLITFSKDAAELLSDLQSRNERMFNMTFLMLHLAPTKQKLEIAVSQSASVAQTHNCILTRLDFQQEDGLMSSLPLGLNRIKIERSLTTSALAVFIPFVTQELFMGGSAMYYGLNALSNNMILLDRKQSRCPNGLVFGTPGSGKSMSCKREITYVMLTTKDNVIICDPEDEYSPLVNRLGGQVIRLSPNSRDYVNPLDINLNYSEEENPLALKSDFVLSFCELIMGSKTGLEAIEKTVIDRAVQMIYQPYFADPRPENMPVLGNLLDALMAQGIPEAERVAQALDLYVNGSLNFFNHRTTVDIRNRLVCFDIKGLGKNLKKPGMLIVQDAVWNTVTVNRSIGRATWYFVDEFHLLLKEEQTAAYSAEVWKRFRKWGGVPTGATQNPKDLLSSPEIENILENSDFIYLLNLSAGDRKLMTERLNISTEQLAYVTNADPGSGLLFFQNVILPFRDEFPKDTELYKLLTTKPSEVTHDGESG